MTEPTWWDDYRAAWRRRPWIALIGIVAVLALVLSVLGTLARGPLAILFIPGLALLYLQHLMVQRSKTL